jgi:hypothetical protein
MSRHLLKDALGWGFALWLFGYVLGILLFAVVATRLIGWIILPAGVAVTLWVLFRRVSATTTRDYIVIAVAWTAIAIVFDFVFIVKAFHPSDGYYKPDVFLYYALTLVMPTAVGLARPAARIRR